MTTKNKTTHTPGPWGVNIAVGGPVPQVSVAGETAVCILSENGDEEANARLIAAAPDLLEQLKAWRTWAETLPGGIEQFEKFARKQNNWADAPVIEHTRAAIAKATGNV